MYGIPDTQIKRLQKVQNTAARILTKTGKNEHIAGVLKTLHRLPVDKRIQFNINLITYKCLNNEAPEYLSELLTSYSPTHTLRSADKNTLSVPNTRLKTYGDRAFAKCAPTLWNSLPEVIKNSTSTASFKCALKGHLFGL